MNFGRPLRLHCWIQKIIGPTERDKARSWHHRLHWKQGAHIRQQQQYPAIISEQETETVQPLQNQLIAAGSDHM